MITLPYLLFSCKKCGSATFADASHPIRICDKCGYKHDIANVIPIKRFDTLETALAECTKRSDRFFLSKCRKCGAYIIADETRQIRKCPDPKCRHKNDIRKLRRLASFDSMLEAQNALRYIQIPEDQRDQSPFKRSDGSTP